MTGKLSASNFQSVMQSGKRFGALTCGDFSIAPLCFINTLELFPSFCN